MDLGQKTKAEGVRLFLRWGVEPSVTVEMFHYILLLSFSKVDT